MKGQYIRLGRQKMLIFWMQIQASLLSAKCVWVELFILTFSILTQVCIGPKCFKIYTKKFHIQDFGLIQTNLLAFALDVVNHHQLLLFLTMELTYPIVQLLIISKEIQYLLTQLIMEIYLKLMYMSSMAFFKLKFLMTFWQTKRSNLLF